MTAGDISGRRGTPHVPPASFYYGATMIPGLLDSQIKTMSGREIAKAIMGTIHFPSLKEPSDLAHKSKWDKHERNKCDFVKTLGALIDDIRTADRT